MNKLSCLAVVLAIAGVMGADAQGAELAGALQYPPPSIGKDAQPQPPPEWCASRCHRGASNWG
jgi:hypothetical protein